MVLCDKMLKQLESDDPELVREAAFKAGEEGCESVVPLLVGLISSRNLGVQEAAEYALRKIGGAVTVAHLVPFLRSDDVPIRNLAMDVLREVGNQDFRTLNELLHDADDDIRIFAADILGSTRNVLAVGPLCEALLRDPEVNVRYQAAVSLGNLGKREAAKCLNRAMSDEEWVQFAVIEALSKIRDESGVDALVKALDTSSDLVASMIVEALGEMGNVKAVNMLLRRMDNSPVPLRNKIAKAVIKILGAKSLALLTPAEREKLGCYLVASLDDEDKEIQDAAIQGLAYIGDAKASERVLMLAGEMDLEAEQDRQERAIEALAAMGLSPALEAAIREGESWKLAMVAVEVMARLTGPRVSGILMDVFWGRERDLQREIVRALLEVAGPEANSFFLDVLGRHGDGTVLKAALKFLGMKTHYAPAGEKMFELLSHPYNDVKEAALEASISLGGPEMASRFEALLGSAVPMERLMGVYAMGRLGLTDRLESLGAALDDPVPDVRKVALESMVELAGTTDEMLSLVVGRMHDASNEARLAVVDLLVKWPVEKSAPHLIAALDDPDDWVRIRAMDALGTHRVKEALEKLVALLSSDNKLLVLKVIENLGEIGGQSAFRILLDLAHSEDPEIQTAAHEAVLKIQEEGGIA